MGIKTMKWKELRLHCQRTAIYNAFKKLSF